MFQSLLKKVAGLELASGFKTLPVFLTSEHVQKYRDCMSMSPWSRLLQHKKQEHINTYLYSTARLYKMSCHGVNRFCSSSFMSGRNWCYWGCWSPNFNVDCVVAVVERLSCIHCLLKIRSVVNGMMYNGLDPAAFERTLVV